MNIIWLPVAQEDLNQVFDFYAEQSVSVAIDIYNNIIAEADIFINHPYIGQVEPLLSDLPYTFRSLLTYSKNHKIVYYIHQDTLYISHIWDCRRDPKSIRRNF